MIEGTKLETYSRFQLIQAIKITGSIHYLCKKKLPDKYELLPFHFSNGNRTVDNVKKQFGKFSTRDEFHFTHASILLSTSLFF